MNDKSSWITRPRFGLAGARGLAVLCLLVSAQAAQAQEAGKQWISQTIPTQPQLTEAGIQEQIKLFFEQFPGDDTPDLMVSGQLAFGDRTVYKYDFQAQQPLVGAWSFQESLLPNAPLYGSEPALKTGIEQRLNQLSANDGCPAVAAVAISPAWTQETFWEDERTTTMEFGEYSGSYSVDTGGQCEVVPTSSSLMRERAVDCPDTTFLDWRADLDACGGPPFQITYETAPLPKNECSVGNPCDPTTGDKSEPAPDFDLGWIAFDRHYHSMTSVARSGFGTGWTHSHNLQLAMGVDPAAQTPTPVFQMGLIEADGSQVSFTAVGAAYEASDGSGDRVVADGAQWLLYRSDRVLRFDEAGRVLEQRFEDGTSLTYVYDAMRRLSSITHSSGRSLVFEYAGTHEAAPIAAIRSAGVALASYTYTAIGQVETVTYPGGGQRSYHYEDTRFPHYLTGVTGEDAQRYSTFAYDAKARVVSSVHAGGADGVSLSYPASGGSIVTDALGNATTYGLTAMGASGLPRKPEAFTDSRGSIARTYYDESVDFRRRLKTVTDRNGVTSGFAYAQANDPVTGALASTVTTTQAVGTSQQRAIVRRHDLASNRPIYSSVGDSETRIVRNARLQPASVSVRDTVSNATRTTTYAYCEAADVAASNSACPILGLPKSADGPRSDVSDVTGFEYYGSDDSTCAATPALCTYRKGDLRKSVDALGRATEVLGYDPLGRPLSVLDPNGVVTDYEYHPRGWLTATKVRGANNASEADDRITRIEYWPTGLVKKVTLPDGAFTTYAYDAAQRLTDIADNDGNTVHYSLDLAGNRQQEDTKTAAGALRRTLSRVFNTLGQLHIAKDAGQNPTTLRYDVNGRNDRVTDALGRVTDQSYDPLGRLSRSLQDVGGLDVETAMAYNALDQVTQVTDPKGLNTVYAYNGFGDRTQLTSPDTGVTVYTYNAAGLLATKQDANDAAAHRYTYDALNRPTAIFYTATGPADVEYDYDTVNSVCAAGETFALGRVTAMRTEGTQLQYCYDRFGQVVRKVQSVDSKSFSLRYAYTAAGDLQSMTYPDGAIAQYTRDSQGRIGRIDVAPAAGPSAILLHDAAYQPFGPVNAWQYGNGRGLQRDYDLDYRAKTVFDPASGGLSLSYGYNAISELTELKDGLQSTSLAKYDYDPLGRLKITRDGPTGTPLETYGYDATGNRTSLLRGGVTDTYSYPAASHRLSGIGAANRSYDAVGNTIAIGGTAKEYVYNANDRMRQVKQGGVVTMGYRYNAKGERVAATNGDTGPVTTYTLYDEAGHWIGDYDSAGATVQQAIWFDDAPVGLLAGAGAAQSLKYVQPDHLGTPRAVIDPARNLAIWTWDAKSEAFGNSPPNQDPDLDGVAFVFDMRFPGQRYDVASGLMYNYFRDYESATGRYVQSDPIGLIGGINTYSYTGSSPIRKVDPYGLQDPFLEVYPPRNYTECETQAFLDEARKDVTEVPMPIRTYRMFKNHTGKFDFKYTRKDSTFRVDGKFLSSAAFGNYIAGYASKYYYPGGYTDVRMMGVIFDYIDGSKNLDRDSISDIDAGANRADAERNGSASLDPCGCHK